LPNLAGPELDVESRAISYSDGLSRSEILPQQLFVRMICLERKRSERAGTRLVLMLLESTTPLPTDQFPDIDKVLLSLPRSTRETAVTGWYREGYILGVLFTEVGASGTSAVEILTPKVHRALRDSVGMRQLSKLRLLFHVFPDDCLGQGPAHAAFSMLYPDLVQEIDSKRASLVIKRCIDVAGSFLLVLLLAPLLLLIAAVIKVTSSGPVLFRQKRLGQFGEGFTFLKFRSMYAKTDHSIHEEYIKRFISNQAHSEENANGQKVYKLKGDPRITKVGGFLRRTSLDELPQLFNVLAGKMSLVGPRPPLPYEFQAYEVWHRRRLHAVRPGITGFWQVEGRSRVKFDDMVRMDLEYARAWSLWLDLKILLRTPRAVFGGAGAF
jgi:lipopolysaccharide/colanic/teichoic acid biosynthesis glycosyltransferase